MRTIEAMQRQLLGLIGRAVVKSISAATKCQTVDVSLIAGEPKAGVEHLEPYGFTARANSGAEAVVLFPDGDRSHAVVVTVSDRRYRLKGLQTGEVAGGISAHAGSPSSPAIRIFPCGGSAINSLIIF